MEASARSLSTWRAALLVGLLSAILGASTLGSKSLWVDEVYNAVRVPQSWEALSWYVRATEMSQSAYLVFLKPWTSLAGTSETALRVPSVLAAALACAFMVPLGARLFDRTTGIVAGVLLATNQFLVAWSQQARTYALVTFAIVLASLLFVRALDDPSRRNWLLYALAAAFAVYCHFYAGFVVVAHLVSVPFAPRRPPLRRVAEAAVAFLLLCSVAAYFVLTADRIGLGWIPEPSFAVLRSMLSPVSGDNPLAWLAAVGGLLVLAHRVSTGKARAPWQLALVGGWIVLPFALGLLVSLVTPIVVPRYLIVVVPGLALAGAVLLATLFRSSRRTVAVAGVAAAVAVVAVSAVEISQWYRSTPEDWRGAVAYVERVRGPNDAVVVAPGWATDAARYYAPDLEFGMKTPSRRTFVIARVAPGEDDAVATVRELLGPAELALVQEERLGDNILVQVHAPRG